MGGGGCLAMSVCACVFYFLFFLSFLFQILKSIDGKVNSDAINISVISLLDTTVKPHPVFLITFNLNTASLISLVGYT